MKKVTQILVALVVSLGLASLGTTTYAQQPSCDSIVITNTGPNSNNQGVCTVNVTATVTCSNNIYALTQNSQTAVSGAASGLGNTTSGAAVSGDATNENGTVVQVGAACGEVATPVTPTMPTTPVTPTVTPMTTAVEKPTALPYTASSSTGETALIVVIALATVALTARVALSVYRRLALK